MPENNRNSANGQRLLQKIRSVFSLNIGTMLFGVLFIYMLFSLVLYLTSSNIESYLVIAGPLSRNETYTGLAIRTETVCKADTSGYVSYYAREGSKINANGVVYGISSSQKTDASTDLSAEDLSTIRSQMLSFSKGFNASKFNNTYSFKYNLEGSILQYAGVSGASSDSGVINYGGQTLRKADQDGIILYATDGYENKTVDTLTEEDFDQNAYHETDLKTHGSVSVGDSIYTLISDEKWSLMIPLSEKQAVKLADRTVVRVKFLKDDMTQSGDFSIVQIDGSKYGRIDFNKGLIRYASDRFLEIELVTNTVTGLKIPLSSIVTKEFYQIPSDYATTNEDSQETGFMVLTKDKSGNEVRTFVSPSIYAKIEDEDQKKEDESEQKYIYYVDKKSFKEGDVIISEKNKSRYVVSDVDVLEGVYCINQGYAVFRRIEILDQNEEYAIVAKSTAYGLARYDHIVRNADKVDEEEILY
nr:HlyD family efflux transporter periplasmic adaptor subunit [uncultured Blautia sp.]